MDLTSQAYGFRQLREVGDFYGALGLAEGAGKLDVDVAAARLAERMPWMAADFVTLANLLTHPGRSAVYQSMRGLCNRVTATLVSRHGEAFIEAIPNCRQAVWKRCCDLFRFDLAYADMVVGPRGAASLAARGMEWIIESLTAEHLIVVCTTRSEDEEKRAVREIWLAACPSCGHAQMIPCRRIGTPPTPSRHPEVQSRERAFISRHYQYSVPACPRCRNRGGEPSEYDDAYAFRMPATIGQGTVLQAQGELTGKWLFAMRDGKPVSARPTDALARFYRAQQGGDDVSLESILEATSPQHVYGECSAEVRDLFSEIIEEEVPRTPPPRKTQPGPVQSFLGAVLTAAMFFVFLFLHTECRPVRRRPGNTPWNMPRYQSPLPSPKFEEPRMQWPDTDRDANAFRNLRDQMKRADEARDAPWGIHAAPPSRTFP